MPVRAGLVTALAAAIVVAAAPARATTASYQDGVFRLRASPAETLELQVSSTYLRGQATNLDVITPETAEIGPGCGVGPEVVGEIAFSIRCSLTPPFESSRRPRYRLTLSRRADNVSLADVGLSGVIYGGTGDDDVRARVGAHSRTAAATLFGGPGLDTLVGTNVYGGPGPDIIGSPSGAVSRAPSVLRGGPGGDLMDGPGWVYGGRGDDDLSDTGGPKGDMFVGGLGRDRVWFEGGDGEADLVRIRGGGRDRVTCRDRGPDRVDLILIDRFDKIDRRCRSARIELKPVQWRPPS
jgi:hypothetical protein